MLFLRSERSERSLLGNFWISLNSEFVRNLGCSNFLDLVCCFCGVSEASGAYSETFGFEVWGLFVFFWICFVVFVLYM